jgi:hypothetical protein
MSTKLWPVEQLLEWVNKSSSKFLNVTGSEFLVLIALAKHCDSNWTCFPSISVIANLCFKERKHLEDVLDRLVKKNILLKKERYTKDGDRDTNQYTILVDNLWKVGANSPLPWGQIYPDRRGKYTPLTINLTNHVTKKQRAPRRVCTQKKQKPVERKDYGAPRKLSPILEDFISKMKNRSKDD